VVKEGVNSGNQGGGVNSLTRHLEVEAGWRGVADGANGWGPLGGDRGRRRRRRATQT
jgi:hypothetical protein